MHSKDKMESSNKVMLSFSVACNQKLGRNQTQHLIIKHHSLVL